MAKVKPSRKVKPRGKSKGKASPKGGAQKESVRTARKEKRASKSDDLEVIVRRATTIENRAVGVGRSIKLERFRPVRMTSKEYDDSIRGGFIRESDVLQAKPVKGGKS